jgi:hypothetical protein
MKNRNLIIGAITGAAVGAAASYLMDSKDRNNLVSNLKGFGEKAMDMIGNVPGMSNFTGESSSSRSASSGSRRSASSSPKRG